jgi:hypothetical protein
MEGTLSQEDFEEEDCYFIMVLAVQVEVRMEVCCSKQVVK